MPDYTWQEFLRIGVDELDDQHKRLLDIANDFQDALRSGRDRQAVHEAARALRAYAGEHFTAEERYMASIAFPGLEEHRQRHEELLRKAAGFVDTLQAGGDVAARDMDVFIKTWILNHVLALDIELTDAVRPAGDR